jgi:hypothetical protein
MECISYRERDSLTDLLCLTLGELHETFSSTDRVDMEAKLWKAIVNIKRSEFTFINTWYIYKVPLQKPNQGQGFHRPVHYNRIFLPQ